APIFPAVVPRISAATVGIMERSQSHVNYSRTACGIEKSPFCCDRSLVGSRRDAELLPERCNEVGRRRIAGLVRHIDDRQAALTKEHHRALTAPPSQADAASCHAHGETNG